jgi:biopolymer transport protein ExbD
MGKIKIKRKSTNLDMTAMCDVAFLLLTFFMLTTKFRPPEPLQVDTPSSIVAQAIPDKDLILVILGKDGRTFLDVDQQQVRIKVLELMGEKYGITFTQEEKTLFANIGMFGAPMANIKQLLSTPTLERDAFALSLPGIPSDTTADWSRCELQDWIVTMRRVKASFGSEKTIVAVKGDVDAQYPAVKNLIAVLQKQNINQFSFVTDLEANPNKKKE